MARLSLLIGLIALIGCKEEEATVSTSGPQTIPNTGSTDTATEPSTSTTGFGTESWTTPSVPGDCTNVVTIDEGDWYGDWSTDGIPESIRVDFYDPHPNLTRSQYHATEDYSSAVTYAEEADYDAEGRVVTSRADYYADGQWDQVTRYTWDGDMLTQRVVDWGDDGVDDEIEVWVYSQTGVPTERTYDADGDGVVDDRETYGYDADDRVVLTELDEGDDGTVELTTTFTYADPAPSMDYEAFVDAGPGPQGDSWYLAEFDADGNQIYYGLSYDDSDSLDEEYWWSWDANGQITEQVSVAIWYGYPTTTTVTWSYADVGKVETLAYDLDFGFGYVWMYREDSHWACP